MTAHRITHLWGRRAAVLLTVAATAATLAGLTSPAAQAAKPPPPPPTAQLEILEALDDATTLPSSAPDGNVVGYVRPGQPFNVTVQSQTLTGDPLPVGKDTDVTLSGGGVSAVVTIPKDANTATLSGLLRSASSNFVLTATGPKNSGYAADTIPVTVAVQSFLQNGLGANQTVVVQDADGADCVLGPDNPTCVSLSVSGDVPGSVVLSTSECANFFGAPDCLSKRGRTTMVAQTFVDLAAEQVATAILYCDKSLCGQGGVAQYIPLVDKGNTGVFEPADECPARGELGDLHVCVDLRQSTRFNAGDLATYILFDSDLRSTHP